MSFGEYFTLDEETRRLDEKILNVIRTDEAGFVGTTEVVDDSDVNRGEDTVRSRLDSMEEEGRVEMKRLGHPERGNLAWFLSENERTEPVDPDIYWIARVCDAGRGIGSVIFRIGWTVALVGMMMVMMTVSVNVLQLHFTLLNATFIGMIGYGAAIGGFTNVAVGGGLKWGLGITETIIERRASVP